ncbi:MAG TPA: hypothetical protein VG326_21490 [Tepidisphaeraceae bacterium]|jgi:hypothetical protein|nr:hypothetical protein [Tepidisphaeraceae bacterium]
MPGQSIFLMFNINKSDIQRVGESVRRTEKVLHLSGPEQYRRGLIQPGFWAKLNGYTPQSGSSGPWNYQFAEQHDTGTSSPPTLGDKPSGRTDSITPAVNGWEVSTAGAHTPPIPSGTIVWMVMTFDAETPPKAVFRFNQLPPPMFPVKVSTDGGSAGSMTGGTTCDFTYTVYAEDGSTQLATTKTPDVTRYSNCKYDTPGSKTPGLAYLDNSGAIHLYSVAQEKPSGTVVTNVTAVTINDSSHTIVITSQPQLVLDAGTTSTSTYTGASC